NFPGGTHLAYVLDETGNICAIHFPNIDLAGSVFPKHIFVAIVVEVADRADVPFRAHRAVRNGEASECGAAHGPDGDMSCGADPKDVRIAVAIEVTNAGNVPLGTHFAGGDSKSN